MFGGYLTTQLRIQERRKFGTKKMKIYVNTQLRINIWRTVTSNK